MSASAQARIPQIATYFSTIASVFNRTMPKDEQKFKIAIEGVFLYVKGKHNGRCISKRLFDDAERCKMIQELFTSYSTGDASKTLCQTGFMRRIVKHDQANDKHATFILEQITKKLIGKMPLGNQLLAQAEVVDWVNHFNMTTMDPDTVASQKEVLETIPAEYQKILSDRRMQLGEQLMVSITDGWLDKDKVEQIIQSIATADVSVEVELTAATVVVYYAVAYKRLILSGKEHAPAFQTSLLIGLKALKASPSVPNTSLSINAK